MVGRRALLYEDLERSNEYEDMTLLTRMVSYLLEYKGYFIATCIFVAINIIVNIWAPFVLRHAIDVDFISGDLQALAMTALFYVVLRIGNWLSNYGSGYLTALMGQRAVYSVRQELFGELQKMGQDFYDDYESGRVISRLTNDVDRMSEFLSGGLINTMAQFFIIFAIGGIIFTVDVQLAIVSLAVVPLLGGTAIFFRKKMREAYRSTRKTISSVTANLAESISGAKVTKSFAREKRSAETFEELNKADYESNIDASKASSTFFPSIRFVGAIGVFLILWIGGMRLTQGTLSLGTLVLFIRFNEQFFRPMLIISNFYNTVQAAFAGSERVFTIMDSEPSIEDKSDAIEMPPVKGRIEFEDVTFGYVKDTPVLEDFNLEIEPGETIALVGDTGAGKTTVVNLLNRFYDVWEGSVKIDGIDVRDVTQESLHSTIGIVLQDPFLFMGTVKENIAYGRPDATDEEIMEATEAIGARKLIENLDNGFETGVGERGSHLSEGERQLVSFARALLADPRILVLDEATSSIDVYTEHTIQKGMETLLGGRTSLVIAHRLSTIVNADRIVVIEDGEIVESGKHEELMKNKGKYFSLYELQLKPRAMESTATV